MDQVQLAAELKDATTESSTLEVLRKCVISHYRKEWLRYFDTGDGSTLHIVGMDELVDKTTRTLLALKDMRISSAVELKREQEESREMEQEDSKQTYNVKGVEFLLLTQGTFFYDNRCTQELEEWVGEANQFMTKHEVSKALQELYRKAFEIVGLKNSAASDESDKE